MLGVGVPKSSGYAKEPGVYGSFLGELWGSVLWNHVRMAAGNARVKENDVCTIYIHTQIFTNMHTAVKEAMRKS